MSFEVGGTIGDYQIIGLLGAGGMGKVYKVKNTISDRIDAIKVLLPDLSGDPDLADRFMREIKVLASLNHPNIAGLRTAFRADNQLLMVMEYVEGTSLDATVKAGPIPVPKAIDYITQVLAALGYAHKRGVIHRDIKPANMMLTSDGVIKLMDFGIAKTNDDRKLTRTGATLGSLYYMSAEQVQGGELDGRSDLYSVGVSLYEMVTGSRPFKGKSEYDVMIAQLQQAPLPPIELMPDIPKALNDIIVISLEKDPAKRFQTAEAFSAALASVGRPALQPLPAPSVSGGLLSATGLMSTVPAPVPEPAPAAGGKISLLPTSQHGVAAPPQVPAEVAPVAPSAVPAPGKPKGYRGLYMTLGALIALAVLVAAATQLPRVWKTHAGTEQPAQGTTPAAPPAANAQNPAAAPSTPAAGDLNPPESPNSPAPNSSGSAVQNVAGQSAAEPAAAVTSKPAHAAGQGEHPNRLANNPPTNQVGAAGAAGTQKGALPAATDAQSVASPPAPADPARAQELAELSDLQDKLTVRAQTENNDVESLRSQMASSGNNLRSDVSASQSRMNADMAKFAAAISAGDTVAARKYMGLAEHEVEFLEKFFGH